MSGQDESGSPDFSVHRLGADEVRTLVDLNAMFAEVFDDPETYAKRRPSSDYLADLLRKEHFIALVATDGGRVIGGLAAYALQKFEQERTEVYIYDLAVVPDRRREGIATRLLEALKPIARDLGAWVIFVQADHGDEPAIALYESLGVRERVLHFDIPVS
ncbi:AAC(3)-I family aminoglycoside N-acetyltransferase [Amorphus orientalis]|uniref:Aminoglycoside 3-N-acetyltransferase I n=1 Tax=Amorphus orientalis TaxID=649198 RepID=A0AAE3VU76_9HYPH|nr:AAC(3)-I family aminoglycoside N-acetyltransferase [Amorphus orientalis]MDQ0317691.1 aminoglycoside 3-N-acetyltransferase I [Amorphus orientalis]